MDHVETLLNPLELGVEVAVVALEGSELVHVPAGCQRWELLLQPGLEVVDLLVLDLDLGSGFRHHGVFHVLASHDSLFRRVLSKRLYARKGS